MKRVLYCIEMVFAKVKKKGGGPSGQINGLSTKSSPEIQRWTMIYESIKNQERNAGGSVCSRGHGPNEHAQFKLKMKWPFVKRQKWIFLIFLRFLLDI